MEHRVEARQRLADLVLELLAGLHELRVRADARGVDHHVALVETHQVDARDAAAPDRVDGLGHAVAVDVLREVVERAAREDRQRKPGLDRDACGARHRAVPATDGEHLGPLGRVAQYVLEVVVLGELDDLGPRQRFPHFVDDACSRPAAGSGLITSTTPAPSGRAGVSTRSGSAVGIFVGTIGGTIRAPSTAIAAPMPNPANTSPG